MSRKRIVPVQQELKTLFFVGKDGKEFLLSQPVCYITYYDNGMKRVVTGKNPQIEKTEAGEFLIIARRWPRKESESANKDLVFAERIPTDQIEDVIGRSESPHAW